MWKPLKMKQHCDRASGHQEHLNLGSREEVSKSVGKRHLKENVNYGVLTIVFATVISSVAGSRERGGKKNLLLSLCCILGAKGRILYA